MSYLMCLMETLISASSIGLMQIKICPTIKALPRALGKLIMGGTIINLLYVNDKQMRENNVLVIELRNKLNFVSNY